LDSGPSVFKSLFGFARVRDRERAALSRTAVLRSGWRSGVLGGVLASWLAFWRSGWRSGVLAGVLLWRSGGWRSAWRSGVLAFSISGVLAFWRDWRSAQRLAFWRTLGGGRYSWKESQTQPWWGLGGHRGRGGGRPPRRLPLQLPPVGFKTF